MPPYADNLYSADDSDDESFSEELSPTDGYFHQREQSRNLMIEDPSIGSSSTAESKAREAREETEALERTIGSHQTPTTTNNPASPLSPSQPSHSTSPAPSDVSAGTTSYTRTSPITTTYTPIPQRLHQNPYSEASPLLYSTAPPAYSPSSSSSEGHRRNYSTISNPTYDPEEGRIPHFRQPESMGAPLDNDNDRSPLIRRPVISRKRKFAQRFIILLAALALAVSFITATVNVTNRGENLPSQPPKKPVDDQRPMDPQPPIDPDPVDAGGPYCPSANHVLWATNYAYNFNEGGRLTVSQSTYSTDSYDGVQVRTVGEIRVRRLPENSPYKNGYITSDVRASDPKISVRQETEKDTGMDVASPQWTPRTSSNSGERPCVSIELTLWVPDGANLAYLKLEAVTLSIRMFPEIKAHVADATYVRTISGRIIFPSSIKSREDKLLGIGLPKMPKKSWWLPNIPGLRPKFPFFNDPEEVESPEEVPPPKLFPMPDAPEMPLEEHSGLFTSRRQYIETTSGSISGTFTLYDYLHISSVSGSLHVSVLPQEEDPEAPAPAELYLHSTSGSIQGYFPFHSLTQKVAPMIPEREYRTHVDSNSGSLKGRFILGNHAAFKSSSGGIQLDMLDGYTKTIKSSGGRREFSTETMSGSTKVELGSAFGFASTGKSSHGTKSRDPMRNLTSTHHGTSGSMHLFYPSAWEGSIVATAISGSLKVEGRGVVIDESRKDWVNKVLKAHKGDDVGSGKASHMSVTEMSGSTEISIGR